MDEITHGWHFLRAGPDATSGTTRDGHVVRVGDTLTVKGPLVICESGLHGSRRLLDALRYAPGPVLSYCKYGGALLRDTDKFCAEQRTVLWLADVSPLLWEFACWCAETAMRRVGWKDERSWAAIETRRRWLKGEATDEELAAARDAAWAAAWDATWDATSAAAWDAARDAASAAAWDTTRDAAWEEQNEWLTCAVRSLTGADGTAVTERVEP